MIPGIYSLNAKQIIAIIVSSGAGNIRVNGAICSDQRLRYQLKPNLAWGFPRDDTLPLQETRK